MPKPTARILSVAAVSVLAAFPSFVFAQGSPAPIRLERDTVVPVVIENDITLRRLEVGDRFTAHVDNDRDLPDHTRLIGRVYRIRESRRGDVSADLEFTDVILPDGSRHRFDAIPVSLDDKYVTRRDDGRIVVRSEIGTRRDYVAAGAIGGFIIGSMVHRRFAGTILGAVVGAIAADSERRDETIVHRGQKVGALIERDTTLEFYPGPRVDRPGRLTPRPGGGEDAPPARGGDSRIDEHAAAGDFVLSYEGKDLHFDNAAKPFQIGDVLMVPLQRTTSQLGLTVDRDKEKENIVYVENADSSLYMELDSSEARLNGRKVTLASPLQDRNGVLYVPVDILAAMKKGTFLVNGAKVKPVDSGGSIDN